MPGQYSTHCGRRPCPGDAEAEGISGRLFLCVRCRTQVLICSHCDRGQIYCRDSCAQEARYHAQRAAGRRYQTSRRGRVAHAVRARRWRAQQKNVTHQGSPPPPLDDGVSVDAVVTASKPSAAISRDIATRSRGHGPPFWRCHWCDWSCAPFVRNGFLRRRQRGSNRGLISRRRHDHSP